MISTEALSGYLMEEVIAWLLQKSGYSLVESADPTDDALIGGPGALFVKGRGGRHQADVLGDFVVTPPFSLPLRLLVEVKARGTKATIRDVRNAVGTIDDINQRWQFSSDLTALRHRYVYALFSTAGFAADAQTCGLAHDLGLVDLSGPEWEGMVTAARTAADRLIATASRYGVGSFPVRLTRIVMREELGTAAGPLSIPASRIPESLIREVIASLVDAVRGDRTRAALLAFAPSAPSGLIVRTDDLAAFLQVASRHPTHAVRLLRARVPDSVERFPAWVLHPAMEDEDYQLRLSLPPQLEERISEDLDRRQQILAAKGVLGGSFTIFVELSDGSPFIATLRLPLTGLRD